MTMMSYTIPRNEEFNNTVISMRAEITVNNDELIMTSGKKVEKIPLTR